MHEAVTLQSGVDEERAGELGVADLAFCTAVLFVFVVLGLAVERYFQRAAYDAVQFDREHLEQRQRTRAVRARAAARGQLHLLRYDSTRPSAPPTGREP